MITKEEIKEGLNKAYKKLGHNTCFSAGFKAGVKFAQQKFINNGNYMLSKGRGKDYIVNKDKLLEKELIKIATQLEEWAEESIKGGWSTHQVKPMREKAKYILKKYMPATWYKDEN